MSTKDKIIEEALSLFSVYGYSGTSVKNIADAVGIKDASLYNHFKSKQEILNAIVCEIKEHVEEISRQLYLPMTFKSASEVDIFYSTVGKEKLKELAKKMVTLYLTDPFIPKFWRLCHIEQYQNKTIYQMFRSVFMDSAIEYETVIIKNLMDMGIFREGNPKAAAISFYSPVFMLLTRYSSMTDNIEEALDLLDMQVDEFVRLYEVDEKNENPDNSIEDNKEVDNA